MNTQTQKPEAKKEYPLPSSMKDGPVQISGETLQKLRRYAVDNNVGIGETADKAIQAFIKK